MVSRAREHSAGDGDGARRCEAGRQERVACGVAGAESRLDVTERKEIVV